MLQQQNTPERKKSSKKAFLNFIADDNPLNLQTIKTWEKLFRVEFVIQMGESIIDNFWSDFIISDVR
jgi:hypothetical protein